MDKLTVDFLDLQEKILFNKMGICVGITQMESTCSLKIWYEGNKPKGFYFLWQVSFQTFFIFDFDHSWVFLSLCLNRYSLCLMMFVSTTRMINICIIKLCNKLFLGSLDMVNCYIMRRPLAKRRLPTKILR